MSVTETKDFQDSIQCIDCAYEDLGYNGKMECVPRTKGCRAVYPYDLAMSSRIRKADIRFPSGTQSEHGVVSKLADLGAIHTVDMREG